MLAVSIPNLATSSAFVDTATKCLATALTSPPKASSSHARALCAQGHVQHRPSLGDVDPVSPEHRVDPPSQAGFLRQAQEQPERLVGDAILRVVEVEADGLRRHALAARGVVGKEPA